MVYPHGHRPEVAKPMGAAGHTAPTTGSERRRGIPRGEGSRPRPPALQEKEEEAQSHKRSHLGTPGGATRRQARPRWRATGLVAPPSRSLGATRRAPSLCGGLRRKEKAGPCAAAQPRSRRGTRTEHVLPRRAAESPPAQSLGAGCWWMQSKGHMGPAGQLSCSMKCLSAFPRKENVEK